MQFTKAVLIVGGSGFVGTHLAMHLKERYKVFSTYYKNPVQIPGVTHLPVNINNRAWIKRIVYTMRPEVVIYAAGSDLPEAAEASQRDYEMTHAGGAGNVANAAEILAPKYIYISNCYAFDGSRGNYHESDGALPSSALGKIKLGAENFIRGRCLNYAIIRSSPLFGRSGGSNPSFMDQLRVHLDRGEKIEMPDEEIHSFAPVHHLAETVEQVMNSGIRNRIFHCGGLTKMTHFEFAQKFAARFGYDPSLILPRRSPHRERYGKGSERPLFDYSLNTTLTMEQLKIKSLLLEEGFDLIEKKLVSNL